MLTKSFHAEVRTDTASRLLQTRYEKFPIDVAIYKANC